MKAQIMMILITNILQISDGSTMKGICTVHRHSSIYTVNVGTHKKNTESYNHINRGYLGEEHRIEL